MRSKRMRSKKGKSKVDKIKRKSRRKVNSRTKMKKKRSRKTRVNRRSFIRKTKRRMRGGAMHGSDTPPEGVFPGGEARILLSEENYFSNERLSSSSGGQINLSDIGAFFKTIETNESISDVTIENIKKAVEEAERLLILIPEIVRKIKTSPGSKHFLTTEQILGKIQHLISEKREFLEREKRRERGRNEIDGEAGRWFSNSKNLNKLYDITKLDGQYDRSAIKYARKVFKSHNIRVIITQKEPDLLPIDVATIMSLMDWVNRNPESEGTGTPDSDRIVYYIKNLEHETEIYQGDKPEVTRLHDQSNSPHTGESAGGVDSTVNSIINSHEIKLKDLYKIETEMKRLLMEGGKKDVILVNQFQSFKKSVSKLKGAYENLTYIDQETPEGIRQELISEYHNALDEYNEAESTFQLEKTRRALSEAAKESAEDAEELPGES
jgi:hypothetical protein